MAENGSPWAVVTQSSDAATNADSFRILASSSVIGDWRYLLILSPKLLLPFWIDLQDDAPEKPRKVLQVVPHTFVPALVAITYSLISFACDLQSGWKIAVHFCPNALFEVIPFGCPMHDNLTVPGMLNARPDCRA